MTRDVGLETVFLKQIVFTFVGESMPTDFAVQHVLALVVRYFHENLLNLWIPCLMLWRWMMYLDKEFTMF